MSEYDQKPRGNSEIIQSEIIQCVDCNGEFEFTDGEQRYFQEKGLHKPRRCKACRQAKLNKQSQ